MNAMEWNRDLRWEVIELRESERDLNDKPDRGQSTVSFPSLCAGNIGLVVATQIARFVEPDDERDGWHSQEQAWAQTQAQLAWYREMERCGELVQISDRSNLAQHLDAWRGDPTPGRSEHPADGRSEDRASGNLQLPVGYVLGLEGADSIVTLDHLHLAYNYGLRAVGPAHYGPGIYATGTGAEGGLTSSGRELLREMNDLGMILDVTHLSDQAFLESLVLFTGRVRASHTNCRALVPGGRQFSDRQVITLIDRGAVIGVSLDAWMLAPDWKRGVSDPGDENVSLSSAVDHIDHICQLAGNADHAGIGSDLDGGFGKEQTATDLDTIADLQKIPDMLGTRGYTAEAIDKIMNRNYIDLLSDALP